MATFVGKYSILSCMKKNVKFVFLLPLALLLISCKKEDPEPTQEVSQFSDSPLHKLSLMSEFSPVTPYDSTTYNFQFNDDNLLLKLTQKEYMSQSYDGTEVEFFRTNSTVKIRTKEISTGANSTEYYDMNCIRNQFGYLKNFKYDSGVDGPTYVYDGEHQLINEISKSLWPDSTIHYDTVHYTWENKNLTKIKSKSYEILYEYDLTQLETRNIGTKYEPFIFRFNFLPTKNPVSKKMAYNINGFTQELKLFQTFHYTNEYDAQGRVSQSTYTITNSVGDVSLPYIEKYRYY